MTDLTRLNDRIDTALDLPGPRLTLQQRVRRSALRAAACLFPDRTAEMLARRYLSSAHGYLDELPHGKHRFDVIDSANAPPVLRLAGKAPRQGQRRILVVPGHDGHYRQFTRLLRSLHTAGTAPDLLVLPGHARHEDGLCSMSDIVDAIRRTVAEHGPYDGMVAHCVSANAALYALDHGMDCPRVALVSAPLDLRRLMESGGRQYGLDGRCLTKFLDNLDSFNAPYHMNHPWQPIAAERHEALLAVHARDDYAAPVEDVRQMVKLAEHATLAEFDHGDHNAILNVKGAVAAITAFMTDTKKPASSGEETGSAARYAQGETR